jgi:hypothetical protein
MHSFKIGVRYYFRCQLYNWLGVITAVTPTDVVLRPGASCVFEEGRRYGEFVRFGPVSTTELEVVPNETILQRLSITDATEYLPELPTESL